MKRFIAVVVFALIAVTAAAPSFAKEKKTVVAVEEKLPMIAEFSSRGYGSGNTGHTDEEYMRVRQSEALAAAKMWMSNNHKNIHILSLSVTPNYVGGGRDRVYGFTTVTILYTDK